MPAQPTCRSRRPDYRVWLVAAASATAAGAGGRRHLPADSGRDGTALLDGPARLGSGGTDRAGRHGRAAAHGADAPAPGVHHAQVLLCVSGALMMVLINDSLARAFGIAGAASLVRFRTPVDDPRDAAVMFLLMGLGMASGLGAFTMAATGTVMICLFLVVLARLSTAADAVAAGGARRRERPVPGPHVQRVCTRHGVTLEVRELSYGEAARASYVATAPADTLARRAQRRADGRRRGRSPRRHLGTGPQEAALMAAPPRTARHRTGRTAARACSRVIRAARRRLVLSIFRCDDARVLQALAARVRPRRQPSAPS